MTAKTFTAQLWPWDARTDSWVFLTLPPEVCEAIEDQAAAVPPRGFGSVRVEVGIGGSTWRTSVFPSKEEAGFVLPIKKAVRKAEDVEAGDEVTVHLTVLEG